MTRTRLATAYVDCYGRFALPSSAHVVLAAPCCLACSYERDVRDYNVVRGGTKDRGLAGINSKGGRGWYGPEPQQAQARRRWKQTTLNDV